MYAFNYMYTYLVYNVLLGYCCISIPMYVHICSCVHVYIHMSVHMYVGAGFKVRDTEHQGWSPRHHAVHTGTKAAEGKCQRALSQVPQGFRPGLWIVDWLCMYIRTCIRMYEHVYMYPIHPACTHMYVCVVQTQ